MAVTARTSSTLRVDVGLLLIVTALLVVGLVMVYSASYGYAFNETGPYVGQPTYFLQRQVVFALIGIAAMVVLSRIDYSLYRRYALWILLATGAILAPMALLGRYLLRSQLSNSVQPSELAKLGAIIYIAIWLAMRGDTLSDITLGVMPFALLVGAMAGLILAQPDASTAIILILTAGAMFFAAGADLKQVAIGIIGGGVALAFVVLAAPYRFRRFNLFRQGPFSDPLGAGFQTIQALKALNTGGLFGVGLGQSEQKFVLYAAHTDGVFSIIGEELGFVGALLVIGLYGLWTWRGLRIALAAEDSCGMLLGVGLVSWVTIQAALHIAVNTASAPFTGTVLPFISGGGSSLITSLAAVGILLNISKNKAAATRDDPAGWIQ